MTMRPDKLDERLIRRQVRAQIEEEANRPGEPSCVQMMVIENKQHASQALQSPQRHQRKTEYKKGRRRRSWIFEAKVL